MKSKSILAMTLASLLATASLAGCSDASSSTSTSSAAQTSSTSTTTSAQGTSSESEAPIPNENGYYGDTTPITFSYWVEMHRNATKIVQSYAENEAYKKLEEITGVHLEFMHPAAGQAEEQFNLLMASSDLPDIIEGGGYASSYPGGPDKGIADKAYVRLNEYIETNAPYFKALREENSQIAKETITDEGNIWCFPTLQLSDEPPWAGLAIRQDMLDKWNLETPKTIADWEKVLTTFKENGVEVPLLIKIQESGLNRTGAFISAFDIGPAWFQKDGKVHYGPYESAYKDFLELLNRWYANGLLDKDFLTRDEKGMDALIAGDNLGAFITTYGDVDKYMQMVSTEGFDLRAVASPSLEEGQKVHYRQNNNYNKGYQTVVTTSCKDPARAVQWLDYHYSPQGELLFDYGIEGVSYEMKDGQPTFTELMTNNPDGQSFAVLSWKYKIHQGPSLRDWRANPTIEDERIQSCMDVWGEADAAYVMPSISRNYDESKTYSSKMTEISTFVDEMSIKFLLGEKSFEEFDAFQQQLKSMGIEDVIAIQQAALDRYNSR